MCLTYTISRTLDPSVKVILWARGMSTAPAIQFSANVTEKQEEQGGEGAAAGVFSYFTGSSSKVSCLSV